MGKNKDTVRIVIPCRFAYVYCWKPGTHFGETQKYSICAVITKEDKETIRNGLIIKMVNMYFIIENWQH